MYLETSDRRCLFQSRLDEDLSPRESGPQGLRRPRFSFFLFTFQTAREPWRSPLPGQPEKLVHPRTVGCQFTVPVRSFRGAQSHRRRTARRWAVYRRCPRALSTKKAPFFWPTLKVGEIFARPIDKQCLNSCGAVLRPYSCVVLRVLSRDGIATGALQPPSIRPVSNGFRCRLDGP